jgi:hypothetical protein
MRGEVSLVDQFSITIEDRDTAVNTASEKIFLLTLEDIKKMNLKNTIIRYQLLPKVLRWLLKNEATTF